MCLQGLFLGFFVPNFFFRKKNFQSFSNCCFSIVLSKVHFLKKLSPLSQGTEPKSFPRTIQCRTSPKGPLSIFFDIPKLFFGKKYFPQRVLPSMFLEFCDRLDIEKSQRVPRFSYFRRCETFFKKFLGCCRREDFDTLMPFCYFRALEMAPNWAGPGLLLNIRTKLTRCFVNLAAHFRHSI